MPDEETAARREAYRRRNQTASSAPAARPSVPARSPAPARPTVPARPTPARPTVPVPVRVGAPAAGGTGPRVGAIAALAVAASLLLCLIVAIVNSGDSPGSDGRAEGVGGTVQAVPDRAQVQATAFSALLDESISGRDMLRRAIEDIVACRVTGGTRANIVGAVGARRALIEKLDRTDVSGLSGGAAAKTALREALSASLRADQAYLVWFDAAGGACPSESAPSFAAVGSANQQATAAKKAFLQTWNPIATARGMPARSAGSI